MTNSKKKQIRNTIALICAVCLSGSLTTGCGASPASADDQVVELPTPAASDSTAPSQPETAPDGTEQQKEAQEEKPSSVGIFTNRTLD